MLGVAQHALADDLHPAAHRLPSLLGQTEVLAGPLGVALGPHYEDAARPEARQVLDHRLLELDALAHNELGEVGALIDNVACEALRLAVAIEPIQQRIVKNMVAGLRRRHPLLPVGPARRIHKRSVVRVRDRPFSHRVSLCALPASRQGTP